MDSDKSIQLITIQQVAGFLSLPPDCIKIISDQTDDSTRISLWLTHRQFRSSVTLPSNMKKSEITSYAVRDGNLGILEWLRKSYPLGMEAAREAGRSKNPLIINYFMKIKRLIPGILEGSVEVADTETADLLMNFRSNVFSKNILEFAIRGENKELLDKVYNSANNKITLYHWILAAECKTAVSIKWLATKVAKPVIPDVWPNIISCGNLEILTEYQKHKEFTWDTLYRICDRKDIKQFDIVKDFIKEETVVLEKLLYQTTDDEFRRHVVGFFVSKGCIFSEGCVNLIFKSRDVVLIESVIDFNSPNMLVYAAYSGYLDILKRVYETGKYKLTEEVMIQAAKSGELDMIEYLIEQKSPCLLDHAVSKAAQRRKLDIVKALVAYNGKFPNNLIGEITEKDIELLTYFFTYPKFKLFAYQQLNLAKTGNIKMLEFLKGKVVWSKQIIVAAVKADQLETVKWCIENGCPITLKAKQAIACLLVKQSDPSLRVLIKTHIPDLAI